MLKRLGLLGAAATIAAMALSGCTQQSKDDYSAAGSNITKAVKETGQGLKSDAEKAGAAIKADTAKTGQELSNDTVSGKVKEALIADKTVKTNDLKVDTQNKTVTLQGSVGSAAQKNQATTIAKDKAGPGYTINNQMKASGS